MTAEEKAERELGRRKAALENQLFDLISHRSARPATASRFDLLADALLNVVVDQLFESINSPGFAESLAERGYAVAALPDGDPPTAPDEWLEDAVGLYGWTGDVVDALGHLEDLWRRAYLAGYAAAEAEHWTGEGHGAGVDGAASDGDGGGVRGADLDAVGAPTRGDAAGAGEAGAVGER